MTPEIFKEHLLASASALNWPARIEASFTSNKFRGRDDVSEIPLPRNALGLRLGDYPVIVAALVLDSKEGMVKALRALHNQMIIARSYMRAEEVINAHILICANVMDSQVDVQGIVDLAERDEAVCRKLVWIPKKDSVTPSYKNFLARTFLARPWSSVDAVFDAPLDHNQGLIERILVKHGLTESVATRWVHLATLYKDDPEEMIPQLVAAGKKTE